MIAHWIAPDALLIPDGPRPVVLVAGHERIDLHPSRPADAAELKAAGIRRDEGRERHVTLHRPVHPLAPERCRDLLRRPLGVIEAAEMDAAHAGIVRYGALLDRLYPEAPATRPLGATVREGGCEVRVWAPTALDVTLRWQMPAGGEERTTPLVVDADGVAGAIVPGMGHGCRYRFVVTRPGPETRRIEVRTTTDPYAHAVTEDGRWAIALDPSACDVLPAPGWDAPGPVLEKDVDAAIYELHVRDATRDDETCPGALRGTFAGLATDCATTRHLRALADAGLTTVHLLPTYDMASLPPRGRRVAVPDLTGHPADSPEPQRIIGGLRARDAFNWGYDPRHYMAPEPTYAAPAGAPDTQDPPADDALTGLAAVRQFRAAIAHLHALGLQVVADVVFNHTGGAGESPDAVLDAVVPGYYHRYQVDGAIWNTTAENDTATERNMCARLVRDALIWWRRAYGVDGFRFDLMGHMPRALLQDVRADMDAIGPGCVLYGEGWDFGEVEGDALFPQARQGAMNGTGVATFTDRLRDGLRGWPIDDLTGERRGLFTNIDPARHPEWVARLRQWVCSGLAGSVGGAAIPVTHTAGSPTRPAREVPYGGLADPAEADPGERREPGAQVQAVAGYAAQPSDVITYVDAHDNETLWDTLALALPAGVPLRDRVRLNTVMLAAVTLAQSPVLWHAGAELLRSKSLDRNSYDSGDHFNRYDVTGADTGWGRGLPPAWDNEIRWPRMAGILARSDFRPGPADVAAAKAAALDLLLIRASTRLFRLGSARAIEAGLSFPPTVDPRVVTVLIDARRIPARLRPAGDPFRAVCLVLNPLDVPIPQALPDLGGAWRLHPVLAAGSDPVVARVAPGDAIPARTAPVFVVPAS